MRKLTRLPLRSTFKFFEQKPSVFCYHSSLFNNTIDRSGAIWKEPEELAAESKIASMVRVDHAGELGAVTICKAQKLVLGEDPIVNEILSQEVDHFATFDKMINDRRVRPTIFRTLWQPAGYLLGIGSALLGRNYAMTAHEAIETTIFDHYNEQLRDIYEMSNNEKENVEQHREEQPSTKLSDTNNSTIETDTEYFFTSQHQKQEIKEKELRDVIKQYRDEELHHHDIARDANLDRNSLLYNVVYQTIAKGCSLVIFLTKRF